MIHSMTGFGKSEIDLGNARYTIEIRSLNSKNLDLNLRAPVEIRANELEIRKIISDKLVRGKVDVFITQDTTENSSGININHALIADYIAQFQQVNPAISVDTAFQQAMRMPDVLLSDEALLDEHQWEQFYQALQLALDDLLDFRADEGKALTLDFQQRIQNITTLLQQVPAYEQERITQLKAKIQKHLNEIDEVDNNRFEQELIYYLEKLDISEEKQRLQNHCDYFLETLATQESNGKKLNFICQEIGREINTLGSKSNHADMQKLVVQMKDELEKIKEQILNVC